MDTAYLNNGHVYHTSQDNSDLINDGTIVNTFANVASLISEIERDSNRVGSVNQRFSYRGDETDASSVFFTFPFLFFINYSGSVAVVLHSSIAVGGILYAYTTKYLSFTAVVREVLMLVIAVVLGLFWGVIVSIVAPMRWYSNGMWVIGCLYIGPYLVVLYCCRRLALKRIHVNLILENPSYSLISMDDPDLDLAHDAAYFLSCRTSTALILIWSLVLAFSVTIRLMSGYIAGTE